MDPATLEALKGSIRHWEENLAAETPDDAHTGPSHCLLCRRFHMNPNCEGCPVSQYTGQNNCHGTPYVMADRRHRFWNSMPDSDEYKERWREAAQAELDFLKSLLPESC
jgi:hypothetical protein